MTHKHWFNQSTISMLELDRTVVPRVVINNNVREAFEIAFMLAHPNWGFSSRDGYYLSEMLNDGWGEDGVYDGFHCDHDRIEIQPSITTGEPVPTCLDCEAELESSL